MMPTQQAKYIICKILASDSYLEKYSLLLNSAS